MSNLYSVLRLIWDSFLPLSLPLRGEKVTFCRAFLCFSSSQVWQVVSLECFWTGFSSPEPWPIDFETCSREAPHKLAVRELWVAQGWLVSMLRLIWCQIRDSPVYPVLHIIPTIKFWEPLVFEKLGYWGMVEERKGHAFPLAHCSLWLSLSYWPLWYWQCDCSLSLLLSLAQVLCLEHESKVRFNWVRVRLLWSLLHDNPDCQLTEAIYNSLENMQMSHSIGFLYFIV